jgi:hypothetical protein
LSGRVDHNSGLNTMVKGEPRVDLSGRELIAPARHDAPLKTGRLTTWTPTDHVTCGVKYMENDATEASLHSTEYAEYIKHQSR